MKFCQQIPVDNLISKSGKTLSLEIISKKSDPDLPKYRALPWIGSYFDIPEPEIQPEIREKFEMVMQVLTKDLSVREYRLTLCSSNKHLQDDDAVCLQLRLMAYKDPDAIAHMVYYYDINPETGKRKAALFSQPAMRKGKYQWQWFHPSETHEAFNKTFSTAEFFNDRGF